jgi:SAM-dependent methyltransferase
MSNQWSNTFAAAPAEAMQRYYDDLLVPGLFVPWANLLLDRLKPASGEAALDVASGTGAVARLLAERVGPAGSVLAADISPGMLEISRSKGAVPNGAPIEFVETPAAPLAVESEAFDVVTCQQGLQFFPDRPAALAEMKRALRPGGRVGIAVWDAIDRVPVFARLRDGLVELLGAEAGRLYASGPWGYAGDDFAADFRAAGFRDADVSCEELVAEFASARALVESIGASALAQRLREADPDRVKRFVDETAAKLDEEFGRDGKILSPTASWIATGRA